MQRRPNTNRKLAKARGHKAETPKRRERQLETKVAERTAELRRSEAYLAEAQRLSQTGSWAWSPEEGIRYWSEECYRVLSFDPQGGLPQHEDFIQRLHPDDQPAFRELIQTVSREKTEFEADYRIVHLDGPVRDIHVVGHPVLSTSGHLVEFVGTVIDVTEGRRAEQERARLRQLEADLAHINRVSTLGEMAASLAHEVKQPIAAARNNARAALHFLDRSPPDLREVREAVDCFVGDADRISDVVDRIGSLIKKAPPRKEVVDLNAAILEVTALTHSEAVKTGVTVSTQLAGELPRIQCDRVQLQQVMLNLIVNAIQSMSGVEDGNRELHISTVSTEPEGVCVAVRDTGHGLRPEGLPRLFEPFLHDEARRHGHWPLDLPLDYRSPWWAAVGDQVRAAGVLSFSLRSPLTEPPSVIDVAYGTSRHFGAMRNLVAIGAKRTSTKPRQSSSVYEYAP
jgi:PAS domain S-box-containing protein